MILKNFKTVAIMKKIMNLFVLVAAAAMALVSCQKNEIENPTPQEVEYTFLLGSENDVDSKATIGENSIVWENSDRLGTFTMSSTPTENGYSYITAGTPATFSVYAKGGLAKGDMLFFYYPYSNNAGTDETSVTLSIPTSQDGDDDMPMASIPFEVVEASTTNNTTYAGQINFVNLAAIAEFNVFSSNADYLSEKVQSVTFTSDKALAGSFSFNLTSVNYSDKSTLAIEGYTEKSVVVSITPLTVGSSSADATKVNMVVAPDTYTGTVVVNTDKASYTFNVSKAKEFVRSAVKPLAVDLAKGERVENVVEPEPEGVVTATISFATAEQRTSFSTEEQVWENDGVVFANTKTTESNAVVENVNPVRLYKNSEISIAANGYITKIDFICNTSDYATSLKNSISGSTLNGKTVSLALEGTSDAVSYVLEDGQVRLDGLTVIYSTEGYVAKTLESIAVSGDYKSEFTQGDDFSFGGVITATYSDESTKTIAEKDCTFSGYNMEAVGEQTVTVTYDGKTTTYIITVSEAQSGEDESGWVSTAFADLKDGDQVVIVSTKNSNIYAMSNNNGTGSAPAAVKMEYSNDKLSSEPEAKLVWTVEISGSNYIFHPGSDNTKWLYCTSTNNGVRVGTNANKTFVMDASGYLKHVATSRYLGVYNNQDWRCYTNTTGNTAGQTFKFFVKKGSSADSGETPKEPITLTMSDVTCSTKTENSLTFEWSAVEGASGYQVFFNGADKGTINTTTYMASGLEAATSYTIAVKAVGDGSNYVTSDAKTCTAVTNEVTGGTTPDQNEAITEELKIAANKGALSGSTSISWSGTYFTCTNVKGSTAIRTSDSDHYRVYANSTLKFTSNDSKSLNKVVITCTSPDYASVFKTSTITGGTVSVSGSVVTITASGNVTEISAKVSAQTRINKVVATLQ